MFVLVLAAPKPDNALDINVFALEAEFTPELAVLPEAETVVTAEDEMAEEATDGVAVLPTAEAKGDKKRENIIRGATD